LDLWRLFRSRSSYCLDNQDTTSFHLEAERGRLAAAANRLGARPPRPSNAKSFLRSPAGLAGCSNEEAVLLAEVIAGGLFL
jgi:hypothetical protein